MLPEIFQFLLGVSISEIKCKEYALLAKTLVPNPQIQVAPLPLIIGGNEVHDGEFPHMAIIGCQRSDSPEYHWVCGGSLISELFVLTAAHCANSLEYGTPKRVRLGCVRMNSKENFQERNIVEIHQHPGMKGFYNDIALFRLESPVEFTPYVRPACLNVHHELIGENVIATGFGVTHELSSDFNDHMLKTTIKIYPNENCTEIYNTIIQEALPDGILVSQLCAGNPNGDSDTCHGDSGGPLQISAKGIPYMYIVIGITSFGLFCSQPDLPSFSTKVSYYVPWIEKIVWKEFHWN